MVIDLVMLKVEKIGDVRQTMVSPAVAAASALAIS